MVTFNVDDAPGVPGLTHWPWALVWQMESWTGIERCNWPNGDVLGAQVRVPGAPMLIEDMTITPVPLTPGMSATPS